MSRILEFLKATLLGGLLVVLPIVVVYLLLVETVELVLGLVAPIAEALPVEALGGLAVANLLAILIVVGVCFTAGLFANVAVGARLVRAAETGLLERIPGYTLVRTLSRQLTGMAGKDDSMFAPAVLSLPYDGLQLVYLIEDHGNGFCTVMIPNAPTATAGPVQYVSRERVSTISVPLASVIGCLQSGGVGSRALFDSKA